MARLAPITAALACSRSCAVSTRTACDAAVEHAADLRLVGVAQLANGTWPERRQLGARPDRPDHPARLRPPSSARRPTSRAIRAPASASSSIAVLDAVLRRGWPRLAPKVLVSTASTPDVEVGLVHRPDHVGPGDVEDLVAALVALEVVESRAPAACSIVPIAPSATTTREARASRNWAGEFTRGCWTSRSSLGVAQRVVGWQAHSVRDAQAWTTRPGAGASRVIELDGVPELVDPLLIAAFEGWNDAGDAATAARRAPRAGLGRRSRWPSSTPRTTTTSRSTGRPSSPVDDGRRRVTWPTTRVSVRPAARPRPRRRAGPRHRAQHALAAVRRRAARAVPRARRRAGRHPRRAAGRHPAHPAGAGDRDGVDRGRRGPLKLEQSRYEGPTGIVGVFQDACTRLGIPAVSFWAAVPHYVAQPPCPKATLALLRQRRGPARRAHPARRPARGRPRLGARRRRAGRGGRGRRRLRPLARGEPRTPPSSPRPAARRSPGSSSATSRRRGDERRASPDALAERDAERARSTSRRATRSPAPRARSPSPESAGVGPAVDAASAAGASRSSARRRAYGVDAGAAGRRRPAERDGARASGRAARSAAGERRRRSTPSRCGSGAQQRQPDRHRVDAAARAAPRRRPGCPATSTSSRRRSPTMPGVHVGLRERRSAGEHLGLGARTSRGAGRPGRCRRPARRTSRRGARRAIAEHSTCQPGRPRPNGRVPRRARRGARPRQTRQSSGSFLPGRSGSPPRSAKTASICSRSSPTPRRTPGRR